MDTEYNNKSILLEYNTDPEVFQDMDKFELDEAKKFALSVKLQFPKFSKGFSASDFSSFIEAHVGGPENVAMVGRLSFPNEWQMQVKSSDIREKLIRMGRTKINSRTCWIFPLSQSEVRGYIHWIPNATSEESIRGVLEPYGEVIFMEVQKQDLWTKIDCDSRYFALNLKPGQTMDDIPHFFKISGHYGLITIRGRSPSCFHCKAVGHRKSECQKYKAKLNSYCNRKPGSGEKRTKPRGRRYRPIPNPELPGAPGTSKKKRKKTKATSTKAQQTVANECSSSVVTLESKEAVKAVEKSTEVCVEEDKLTQVKEIIEKLSKVDLSALQGLSNLSNELTSVASFLSNVKVDTQTKLTNTAVESKVEGDIPQEKEEPSGEGKKKKRKKKKKKAASEASNEPVPPNN